MISLLFTSCMVSEISSKWSWSGNVYLRGQQGLENTEDVEATMTTTSGKHLHTSQTPNGKNSPYRRFELNEEQYDIPVNIRVNGLQGYSTLWSGRTPYHENPMGGENDLWLNGALYIQGQAFQQTFLNSVGLIDVPFLIDPENGDIQPFVHLWGQPLDPTQWGGALIEVLVLEADLSSTILDTGLDDASQISNGIENDIDWSLATSYDILILEVTEEGLILPLENPIPEDKEPSLFFSFSLPSGYTRIQVTTKDGNTIISDYASLDGEVLSAMYFSL